jgi:resuscitation-promoting factor RpfB
MHLRRVIAVLSLSLLLSQQVLTQTSTPPTSSETSSTRQNTPTGANCTDNGTYRNSQGQTVKRPERCSSAPEGATAQCRDGSYSFSRSRRGTCSHHGGVAKWL